MSGYQWLVIGGIFALTPLILGAALGWLAKGYASRHAPSDPRPRQLSPPHELPRAGQLAVERDPFPTQPQPLLSEEDIAAWIAVWEARNQAMIGRW